MVSAIETLQSVLNLHEIVHTHRFSHPDLFVFQDAHRRFSASVIDEPNSVRERDSLLSSRVRMKDCK
jgi:hypothetical protein